MLTPRHVATLRAALLFWQEEMCPHGQEAMQPYLESSGLEPLSEEETADVRDRLSSNVCYAVYDPARERLDGTELFLDISEAELAAGGQMLATVILPAAISHGD
jgi:hypothetical protein